MISTTVYEYQIAIPWRGRRTWRAAAGTKQEYEAAIRGHKKVQVSPKTIVYFDKDGDIVAMRRKLA